MVIAAGTRVTLHYSLQLDDGFVADSSGEEPMVFVLGDGSMAPSLERHLLGLSRGDQREFAIAPGAVFPFRSEAAVQWLERDVFPDGQLPEPDGIHEFHTPAGDVIPGRIVSIGDEGVRVDFNHPLSGRPFLFRVEILEVETP